MVLLLLCYAKTSATNKLEAFVVAEEGSSRGPEDCSGADSNKGKRHADFSLAEVIDPLIQSGYKGKRDSSPALLELPLCVHPCMFLLTIITGFYAGLAKRLAVARGDHDAFLQIQVH